MASEKYDGTIRIDTRVDADGMAVGTRKISSQLKGITDAMKQTKLGSWFTELSTKAAGVGKALGSIGKALFTIGKVVAVGALAVLVAAIVVVAALIKGMVALGKMAFSAGKKALSMAKQVDEMKQNFVDLKAAVNDAFKPLALAALPLVNAITQTVINLLNKVAQITAYLTGQTGYWKTISKSAGDTAESAGDINGSLAGFDKLNVLSQPSGGGDGAGDTSEWMELEESAVTIGEKIKGILMSIKNFFQPVIDAGGRLWEAIKRVGAALLPIVSIIWERLQPAFEWIRDGAVVVIDLLTQGVNWLAESLEKHPDIWATILMILGAVLIVVLALSGGWMAVVLAVIAVLAIINLLAVHWEEITGFFKTSLDQIKGWFSTAWNNIKEAWSVAGGWFNTKVLEPLKRFFSEKWDAISLKVTDVWEKVKGVWDKSKKWFDDNVLNPVKDAFKTAWETIQKFMENPFEAIGQFAKDKLNGIISFLNGLLNGLMSGINSIINMLNKISFSIPDWVPGIGGKSFGINIPKVSGIQVPYLAQGAVIPPNAEFLAVLGDQRSGRNIEAPEGLLRQIMREEMRSMNSQPQVIHNVLKLNDRVVYESWDKENRRVGGSMLTKGASI